MFSGRRLRDLIFVDTHIPEALAIDIEQGIKGKQDRPRIASICNASLAILAGNGPEFVSKALDRWAFENGLTVGVSRADKPTDNAFVESFNGRFRDECLTAIDCCFWPTP